MCSGANRTLVIPSGTLDGNVTNVIVIPDELQCTSESLVVRAKPLNTSLPIHADRDFVQEEPYRFATSLGGPRAHVPEPDDYSRVFDNPVCASSFQEDVDDDYYFDMYDSSQDRFVGGSSGDLSGSALQALMGGGLNRITGADQQPAAAAGGGCGCPAEQLSIAAGGPPPVYEASLPRTPAQQVPPPMQSYYGSSGGFSDQSSYPAPDVNCGPCFPGRGGNPNLCPNTCPVRRGIPFGDPNATAETVSSFGGSASAAPCSRSGPAINQTMDLSRPANQTFGQPGPALNQTFGQPGPALNQTFGQPGPTLNQTFGQPGPALNQTFGQPCGSANRTFNQPGGAANRTFNQPGGAANRTFTQGGGANRTFTQPGGAANRTFTQGGAANRTFTQGGAANRTFTQGGGAANRTFTGSCANRTFNRPGSTANQTFARPGSAANQTFARPGPGLNQTFNQPAACGNRTTGAADRTDSQVNINISFSADRGPGAPQFSSTPKRGCR